MIEQEQNYDREEMVNQILESQEQFQQLMNEQEEITSRNKNLGDEVQLFQQYIESIMRKINQLDSNILS